MSELKAEIIRTFGSQEKWAEYMGWNASTASKVMSGKRLLRTDEIDKLMQRINVDSVERFTDIFFTHRLPKR